MKELKQLREMAGTSQFYVSRKSGVERTRLSLAECGHVNLTAEEQKSIRSVLLSAIRHRQAQLQEVLVETEAVHA